MLENEALPKSGTAEQSTSTSSSVEQSETHNIFDKYKDLLRPCSAYRDEYKECKSIKGRFNQYFIFGEYLDCNQWRDDYNNCQKYSWLENKEAANEVIKSELSRRAARLKTHYDNDIWTKRENPPDDWAKPLPQFMIERNKNTYLEIKNNELKEDEEKLKQTNGIKEPTKSSFCTFM